MSPLAGRLTAARRSYFVGRHEERALFRSILERSESSAAVLYIFGPGGVGKSALIQEMAHAAAEYEDVTVLFINGRLIEPTPEAFLNALQQSMGLSPAEDPVQFATKHLQRPLLFIDTYEQLTGLDGWLRDSFLPRMPQELLVIMAGRNPLPLSWRTDPGWRELLQLLPLRNLPPKDSRSFLAARKVHKDHHDAVLDFTHGHPLALSLAADVISQGSDMHFQLGEKPDMIGALTQLFINDAPTAHHRSALEASAVVHSMTEALLANMLEIADSHELFSWLRSLSFISSEPRGLALHELARDALSTDLRWRNPQKFTSFRNRATECFRNWIQSSSGEEQQHFLFESIYLYRDIPVIRACIEWEDHPDLTADGMRDEDRAHLLAMVAAHEGPEAEKIANFWFVQQPKGVTVIRNQEGIPEGFICIVALERASADAVKLDPAIDSARRFLQNRAPLRTGEVASYFRFWMARDSYQDVSPVQSRLFITMLQHCLTSPGLAYNFALCSRPEFWADAFAYVGLDRIEKADFQLGTKKYGVFGHDWRVVPVFTWAEQISKRDFHAPGREERVQTPATLLVLSETEFADAVRQALRSVTQPAVLRNNPLLQSRLVVDRIGQESSVGERAEILHKLLTDCVSTLKDSPRQLKLYRALHHTYFQPAATQQMAAELLDLPFSTYRRHLRSGVEYIVSQLWETEIRGGETSPSGVNR